MKKTLLALFIVASLIPVSGTALATTVLKVDVPEMTRTSHWVVRAHVASVKPVDLRHEGRTFHTDVELLIEDVFKGQDVPSRYVLRLVGGQGSDGLRLWIPGMPTFQPGEEVVLFLEKTSAGHVPCGLSQGVWRVKKDPKGGANWVTQSSKGAHLMERGPDGRLRGAHLPMLTPVRTLGDLALEIQAAQQDKQRTP